MSDEDKDVDIESDDEDLGSTASISNSSFGQADKRAHHNALERKRRDHIKDSFTSLKDSVPTLVGEKISQAKASRAQILKKAAEYIGLMRRKNTTAQADMDDLKRQNKMLEEQIRSLEKSKTAGTSLLDYSSHATKLKTDSSVSSFEGVSDSDSISDGDANGSASAMMQHASYGAVTGQIA